VRFQKFAHCPHQNNETSKTPYLMQRSSIISYVSQVLTPYIPNFIALAIRIAQEKIWLAAIDGPSMKTAL